MAVAVISRFLLLMSLKCFCCFVGVFLSSHDLDTVRRFIF